MNSRPPLPERTLPPHAAARIRASIMASTLSSAGPSLVTSTTERRKVRSRGLLVAAAMVVLLAGAGFGVWFRVDHGVVAAPAPVSTYGDQIISADLGPLTESQTRITLAGCVRPENPAVQEVLAARWLSDGHAPFRWVLYRNADDQVVLCSKRITGPTYAGVRGHRPSDRYPVVALGGDLASGWLPDQDVPEPTSATDYTTAQFFAAGPDVETVQLRLVVNSVPGPWFSGDVHSGYVFLPAFEPGPVPLDKHGEPQVTVERRAFDHAGLAVAIR